MRFAPRMTLAYRGVVIFRKTSPGSALRWNARSPAGDSLSADTLEGIKQLIREAINEESHHAKV